jgi:adenosylcobinamide kinase / adenosylcobinamide-phosphate guanylyltransferase
MSDAALTPSGPPAARIALIGGGARSGKSGFALARARRLGQRRVFIATGQPLDGEMSERIAAHVRTRGSDFRTVEEPLDLPEALRAIDDADVVVVDCLTLWLSNLLCRGDSEAHIDARVAALISALERRRFHALVVTNEVGMGVVPESALGRRFRDLVGRAHQRLAAAADEIFLAILGTILRIRPEPLAPVTEDTHP